MKKTTFFLFCLWQNFYLTAQITDELGNIHILKAGDKVETILKKNNSVYLGGVSKPAFIGGDEKMQNYLFKAIKYTGSKEESALVRFLVTDDGEVQIPFLLKSSGNQVFDNEAIRVVRAMPDWIPAIVDEEYVSCYRTVEVLYEPLAIRNAETGFIYEEKDLPSKGGEKAYFQDKIPATLYKWLSQNLKYPAVCRENNQQGKVIVKFVIEKDGTTSNVSIFESSGHLPLDEESLRVIGIAEDWVPAKVDGKPVRSYYTLPVTFKLEG